MVTSVKKFFFFLRHDVIIFTVKRVFTGIARAIVGTAILVCGIVIIGAVAGAKERGQEEGASISYAKYGYTYEYGNRDSNNFLLAIPINGVILDKNSGPENPFMAGGVTYGYDIKKLLYELADHQDVYDNIYGIILEISSPGGTINGSQAISDGIHYYREKTKKPVYASIVGLGASGGFWSAIAADKVYADEGSFVGSIGVIMGPFVQYKGIKEENAGLLGGGVVTTDGIEYTTLTAGEGKDIGNPYRTMTEKEKKILQASVDSRYKTFVNHVAKQRNMKVDFITEKIGAYPYDNRTAEKNGLIDGTASREEVFAYMAEAQKMEDDFQVISMYAVINPFTSLFMGAKQLIGQPRTQTSPFTTLCAQQIIPLAYYGRIESLCGK